MGSVWDAVVDVVDTVVSTIGRPFGIYTHDETFIELNISRLLTPGEADKSARRSAIRNSGGDSEIYFNAYRGFQRQYKRRYSQKFLESVGYAPSTNSTTRVIDEAILLTHLETVLGYQTIEINRAYDTYLDLDQRTDYAKQFVTNYDFLTGTTEIGGIVYAYNSSEEVSATEVKLRFVRDYNETIVENLTNNFSYDDINNTVVINGEVYDVGIIKSDINASDEYETECTHQGGTLPDEIITTPVQRYDENYDEPLFANECTYVEYRVTSGEIDTAQRYYIELADSSEIYTRKDINVTTIIPMKENNKIANDDRELTRVLKKLNLSHDQLIDSLKNPDIDAAYLMTALDLFINDDTHNKVMFQTFDLMSPGSGNTTIRMNRLSTTYTYTIKKETIQGSVADVGKYVRGSRDAKGITLMYQGSATEYQKLTVSNYNHRYVISGQVINEDFDSGNSRLIIPLDIMNSLKYKEWVNIYENSLCFLAYAIEVVEVKWYETAAFGFLLQVIGIVLTVMSLGADGGSFMAIVEAIAVNLAVSELIMFLAEAIGGEFGALIAAAVAVVVANDMGAFKSTTGAETWLKMADTGLSTVSEALSRMTEKKLEEFNEALSELDDKINDIREKLEEQEEDSTIYATSTLPFGSVGSPNKIFQTTEQYVNSVVNTEWLVDGSWLYDIDGEITRRNSVYVG